MGPTLFVLQLGVTPAYAAYLFIYITAAGIVGRVAFSVLSEVIGRRTGGMMCGFGGAVCVAAAGLLHNVILGGTSLFWLFIVLGDFFYDGASPSSARTWPKSGRRGCAPPAWARPMASVDWARSSARWAWH